MYGILYFIYPSNDRHLGCFRILAIMNNTVINICVQVFEWTCFHLSLFIFLEFSTFLCFIVSLPFSPSLSSLPLLLILALDYIYFQPIFGRKAKPLDHLPQATWSNWKDLAGATLTQAWILTICPMVAPWFDPHYRAEF